MFRVASGPVVRGRPHVVRARGVHRRSIVAGAVVAVAIGGMSGAARATDVSAPAMLQWFEGSWQTIGNRTGDIRAAGYGRVWTPPPGRGDSGTGSVGYDVYDRFDLGSPGNPTRYGTEAGLKRMVASFHQAGVSSYVDLVWNHDGNDDWWSTDNNGHSFVSAGGYPGFYMAQGPSNDTWGDFHSPFASGDYDGKISNLVDIDQASNNVFIRNPVPGYANNLPGPVSGGYTYYGRQANVPTDANRRFYPSQAAGAGRVIYDPATNQSYTVYNFDPAGDPQSGTPVAENAVGYLQRNVQWLMQTIGVDGFRLDATKNMPAWVLNYYDVAAFAGSTKKNLDGSTRYAFSFGEYYGSDPNEIQARIRKDINPASPSTVGGNRDDLDFPLYWAMQSNLGSNGTANDWRNVVNASVDRLDDGLANNGSQGVAFVQAHDSGLPAPYLSNVAYAYTLMRPGNAVVYFNGHELGSSWPNDGRGDALGGLYGDRITNLVQLRNEYGRGNYQERWLEQNLLAYERQDSALVLLSSRNDAGYDSRTLQTSFAPGTHLVEMTGNAGSAADDPNGNIPKTLVVAADGTVNARFLRNGAPGGSGVNGDGYLIYAPQNPIGVLSLSGIARTIGPQTPTASTNGTARLTSIDVVTGNSFGVTLNTSAVTLSDGYRDRDADGDNALVKLDGGVDVNGNGHVDLVTPGDPTYGFEQFGTVRAPGYSAPSGNGTYTQVIDASGLSEGYHYVDVIAFRHRNPGEPAIYSEYTQTVYVDRLKPVSAIASFDGTGNDRTVVGQSTDGTANNMHFFLDLAGNLTDAQVLAQVGTLSQGTNIDVDEWDKTFTNLGSGNHVVTVVTYEMTGNYGVQRFPAMAVAGSRGKGVGDVDFNNVINPTDMSTFLALVQKNDASFNAAADVDADGHITLADVFQMGPRLTAAGVDAGTMAAYANTVVNSAYVKAGTYDVTASQGVYDVTAGVTNVADGVVLRANSVRGNSLNIAGSGAVKINANGTAAGTSEVKTLSISAGGQLDLADNDLVLDYSGTSPANAVRGMLLAGRDGGAWDGAGGIVSSAAAGDGRTAIGYAEASALLGLGGSATAVWDGQVVDATSLLLKYTYYGDANLDGRVDAEDYALMDRGLAGLGSGWVSGDFNYDGVVNEADFLLADAAYARQGGSLSPAFLAGREAEFGTGYVGELLAVAPEPVSGGMAAAGLAVAFLRRRGRRGRGSRVCKQSHAFLSHEVRS